jgi:predicted AAA+ superfamily ATPase
MGAVPDFIARTAAAGLREAIQRGESVLLLGPRQVGKTTLIQKVVQDLPDVLIG